MIQRWMRTLVGCHASTLSYGIEAGKPSFTGTMTMTLQLTDYDREADTEQTERPTLEPGPTMGAMDENDDYALYARRTDSDDTTYWY